MESPAKLPDDLATQLSRERQKFLMERINREVDSLSGNAPQLDVEPITLPGGR